MTCDQSQPIQEKTTIGQRMRRRAVAAPSRIDKWSDDRKRAQPFPFHPYLLVVFPVTALYAANLDETFLVDVGLALVAVLAAAAATTSAMRFAFTTKQQAAIAGSYVLALTFCYKYLHEMVNTAVGVFVPHRYMLVAWALSVIVGLLWLHRARSNNARATRLLNLFSMALAIVSLLSIGLAGMRSLSMTRSVNPAHVVGEREKIALRPPVQPRDIYYLVFDRYGDNQTLKGHFGYDNSAFCEGLRKRGFYIATESRTNYPCSLMSMSSALNMQYYEMDVQEGMQYCQQFQNHRVGKLLKNEGYKYYYFGNWCNALRFNNTADVNYRFSLLPSEFARTLVATTPFGRLFRDMSFHKLILRKFEAVESTASSEGPKFVHAHFLLPHPPWLFDKDGSRVTWTQMVSRSNVENYRNQLMFANKRILEMVDAILDRSTVAPIIVIQADEGPLLWGMNRDESRLAKIRMRTGIISAFHLPEVDAAEVVPRTISPVNTFRLILRNYFGADMPMLADRTFYPEHTTRYGQIDDSRPNRFIDVTEKLRRTNVVTAKPDY
jgi:hypothetical protein